jgi:hypothetical protein
MRIDVTGMPASGKGMTAVTLTHRKEKMSWNVSVYDRVTFADMGTVFDCINDYWATLPAEQQAGIWDTYKQIYATLQTSRDIHALDVALKALVARLYSFMPYDSVKYWVDYKANVRIPNSILDTYAPTQPTTAMVQMRREQERLARQEAGETDDVLLPSVSAADLNYPREMTYLRKDYQELSALSVALRPMVPIWGEYIHSTGEQAGGMFKEYQAMDLLYDTEIPHVEAMDRLLVYMEHSVVMQKQISHSMIVGGLSTTTLPTWLAAGCCVRRIVFGQLHPLEDNGSIIANIFRYVSSTMKSLDGSFGGKINAKKLPMEMNDEDNSSLADMYKVKQETRDADLIAMNSYTQRIDDMAHRVDPTLPISMVHDCLSFMGSIEHQPIHEHQLRLAQWIIKPVISPRGISFLWKTSIMQVLAVTQAALWHWGLYDLASLVTVIQKPGVNSSMQFGNESRSRVPKELVDQLTVLYPHYVRLRGKEKSIRQLNAAYKAIDLFCDLISDKEWRLNAPAGIATKVEAIGTAKLLIIPPDIRTTLAMLMIRLAQR